MKQPQPTDHRASDRSRLGVGAFVVLAGLLVLPGWAVYRGLGPTSATFAAGWVAAMSLLAFGITWHDKRRAQTGAWREPESALHLLELLGGWPGAFVAQRLFRHKTRKASYQFVFVLIIGLHQFLALDSLRDWAILRQLGKALQDLASR